jgi:non-specific serine/threonine protein kinase
VLLFGAPAGRIVDTLESGRTFSHYRIESKLGQGGMGEVYRATDLKLGRPVALKILPPSAMRHDPDARERFRQEARFASVLNHPNVVTIYAVDEADGLDFIAMEYVEGETLRARARRTPVPIDELITFGVQCAEALGAAHAIGLIHRDIKPANILITPKGQAKVLDFGLAKHVHDTAPGDSRVLGEPVPEAAHADLTAAISLTSVGIVMGTLGYMSPEQARGEPLDARSDIFSLGCTIYEAATGKVPFEGPSTLAVMEATWTKDAAPPSRVRPELPSDLDAILGRAMAKNRDDRYGSARELADVLDGLREGSEGRSGAVTGGSRALATRGPSNLPAALTSFIGRKRELAEVRRLLQTTRLVTLSGPGGCGKTRLAIQVASDSLHEVPDGGWLVELAALNDPALVPQSVATVLGVREEPGRPLLATLADALAPKTLLLVLDNCEHLSASCAALVGSLLTACPHLRVVATSQEPLGVPGEVLWRIPMLGVPELRGAGAATRDAVGRYEAVRLFVDRAAATHPSFQLTDQNAAAVAQICRRVDGIPLAIELAAARVKVLAPDQILARLEDRFKLLTGGSRTVLPRQQTLRAAVDWSYDLLGPGERTLLNRLSVFAGGFTLEAAEQICGDESVDSLDVLEMVSTLVDKSLVVPEEQPDGRVRYRLLETIRDYGRERLEAAGERPEFLRRHAAFYLAFAEEAEPELTGSKQAIWLDQLDREHENLRQAMTTFERAKDADPGLTLARALWRFWWVRGTWAEGRKRLAALLAVESPTPRTSARARALHAAAVLARGEGDYAAARPLGEEALSIAREVGDKRATASALFELANIAGDQVDEVAAHRGYEAALALFREVGDKPGISGCVHNLGVLSEDTGDYEAARALYEEGLAINREIGYRSREAASLNGLGGVAFYQGRLERSRECHEQALAIQRELGDSRGTAFSLRELGEVATALADASAAADFLGQSLEIYRTLGDRQGIATAIEGFAALAASRGQLERALRLAGAAAAVRESIQAPIAGPDLERLERYLEPARSQLGAGAEAARSQGARLTVDEAIGVALGDL